MTDVLREKVVNGGGGDPSPLQSRENFEGIIALREKRKA